MTLRETSKVHSSHVIGSCKCGALLSALIARNPANGEPSTRLLHPWPCCAYYANTEPEQILRDVGAPA